MQAIPLPHHNWKTLLLAGQVNVSYIEMFGRLLATIHNNAYVQRGKLATIFSEYNFFETLRLEPYYQFPANNHVEASPFIQQLIADTRSKRITLVHGDYSPKNVLIYNNQLVLLDYEVIHWGDPAFDVGFSMTHFLSKAHYLPQQRQQFAQATQLYWQSYWQTLGNHEWKVDLEERAVRHTLACLLARVAGRSPLEYFSQELRQIQQNIILQAMQAASISTMPALVDYFIIKLEQHDTN